MKNFCLSYNEYNYNTISNYLSKGKIAYDNETVRIERKTVFSKPKPDHVLPERQIVPVVRRISLKDADDHTNDLAYWLSRPASQRLAAVTYLVRQSLKKGQRLDKAKFVKRKLKDDTGTGF